MRCSKCGFENPDGMKFCGQCTAPLALICPKCHFQNPPGFKFCGQCTVALGPATPKPEPSPPSLTLRESDDAAAMDGERKTVTALFADIKGSMDLMEDIDPEEARAIVDPALKLMIDAAHRYGGFIVQSTGDGIFALFGAPIAHEDHPQRALYSALRMQEDLKRYADKLRERGQPPLSVRVGVNSGEVVVRSIQTDAAHTEYTPIGHSISLASRLQTLAAPGSVVIGESVRKFVEGYFQLNALGASRIKGVSEPVKVYEVTGFGPLRTRLQRAAGRGLTKFVGRAREMDAMKTAAEQAKAGHGQIVAAMAEAGVGKSRLLFEFKAVSQSGWMVLETFSVSHGKASTYLPVIDLLHSYFAISSDDDARARRERVNGRVLTLDRSLEDTVPFLFALLRIVEGEDPLAQMDLQIRRRRTFDAIKRILLRESLNQPLMVIFEDLHWIDAETQTLLNLLADSIGTAKVLLLVNYRPEYSHQWGSKTYYTQLRLDPLGKESADEMLSAMLGVPRLARSVTGEDVERAARETGEGASLAALKRLIIEKTEGNPFFMEETVEVLLDDGALVRNGIFKLVKPLAELKTPPTVQAILASRIDRLPADEKDLLQTLAVIGTEFRFGVVRKVIPKPDEELQRMLSALQLAEFIYEQPAAGDVEYTFKHALTHDVAYNSVLIGRRNALHARVGAATEQLFAEHLEEHARELAHHYSRSGNVRKAVDFLYLAGEQAAQRSAYSEAVACFRAAVEQLPGLSDTHRASRELTLQLGLGAALFATEGFSSADAGRAFQRSRELCRQLGDETQLPAAMHGLSVFFHGSGQFLRARDAARELVAIAERVQVSEVLFTAHLSLGDALNAVGDVLSARDEFEHALRVFDGSVGFPAKLETDKMSLLFKLSHCLWTLGYPDQAEKCVSSGLQAARESSESFKLAIARLGEIEHNAWERRDWDAVRRHATETEEFAAKHGYPWHSAVARIYRACDLMLRGQVEEGLTEARAARATLRNMGQGGYVVYFVPLAEALARSARIEQAQELVDEGLAQAKLQNQNTWTAELHRLEAELQLMRDPSRAAEAEVSLRRALDIARAGSARSLELRASASFARLLATQGRRDEARAMLTDIYNWFTEGFDTADLKDAKALLDELSV